MPQPRSNLYNYVFRRNSTFLTAMIVGAFVLEFTGGSIMDRMWNGLNKGKQWEDVKKKIGAQ